MPGARGPEFIRARGFFVWIADASPDESVLRLVQKPYENGFRLAEQLPFLQFNFQFGFVFVEVVAHVGDGK